MPIDTVEILRELVSIPSVNPMGRGDLAAVGEARLTEHLAARLTALGLFVQRQTVAPGARTSWRGWTAIHHPSAAAGCSSWTPIKTPCPPTI